MRSFYACLLLVVSTSQWIGGYVCLEVRHFMEIKQEMTEAEGAISNDIFEETGVETAVNILPEGQHVRRGADYGNYFAYSKADSTGTVYFTIDYAPRSVTWEQVAGDAPAKPNDDASKAALLKLLFAKFLFPSADFPKGKTGEMATENFQLDELQARLTPAPLSPPPDFYC